MSARTAALSAALLASGALAAGCGVGAGDAPDADVGLLVTREYGMTTIHAAGRAKVEGEDTVMRVLQRSARVGTRFGGDFVQSVDGVSGGQRAGRPVDWFVYVNGLLTDQGAGAIAVRGGDRIWWDHHDWGFTPDVPAVVGSYPAPFEHGPAGTRLPVRVRCADPRAKACARVAESLAATGADVTRGALAAPSGGGKALKVLVGAWKRLRTAASETKALEIGPRASGVFARFGAGGDTLALLDERGRVALTLRADAGLVAATAAPGDDPVWIVSGTDDAGVARAAAALNATTLGGHFALALDGDGQVAVPVVEHVDDLGVAEAEIEAAP